MPKGSKKGVRHGGRDRGTPNRATVERAEVARMQTEESKRRGAKLGKDVLEEFMLLFAGMAAQYQPLPEGVTMPGRTPNEEKFITYATLAVKTAKDLADFQSPKFKAIMVTAPPPKQQSAKTIDGNVVQLSNDPNVITRVYQQMVRRIA
jgi:hypothetical protein